MPPVVTKVSLLLALRAGGQEIVITGSGFAGATRVYFRDQNRNETDAKTFRVNSDSQITATTPAVKDDGVHHVYVTVGGSTSTTPSKPALAPDGDGLAATGTFGVNVTSAPSDANQLRFVMSLPNFRLPR
ncbi:IPT/TIG domain-containing protein [Streptomyces sp. NPDC057020]|uniref:IPT/TIG domain-containing protein n=1 Tax=unclassified Streptomyces TaxID=2593676 RepID=UPI0036274CEE